MAMMRLVNFLVAARCGTKSTQKTAGHIANLSLHDDLFLHGRMYSSYCRRGHYDRSHLAVVTNCNDLVNACNMQT